MIVLDASAVLEWLLNGHSAARVDARVASEDGHVHAPHLIDLEVLQVLRRLVREKAIGVERAGEAIEDFHALAIDRHGHRQFVSRIWEHRANLTAYDAAYVALAESLDCPLVTHDARLFRSPGHRARIELV